MRVIPRLERRGIFGAVVSTHSTAAAVGMRMLELGGNAFDAAAAAGLTLQVVEPHVHGPGGEAAILAAQAAAAAPQAICGQGTALPGAFGAWLALLRDHGTLPLAEVLQPAIFHAGGGHPISPRAAAAIAAAKRLFELHWRSSAAIHLPGGAVPLPGQLCRNLPLAMLYAAIATDAARAAGREAHIARALDYWYRGPVAAAIERFVRMPAMDASGSDRREGEGCHVAAADRWGNLVAATASGGGLGESPAIPELGFGLSTRAPPAMPVMAYRHDVPWLACAATRTGIVACASLTTRHGRVLVAAADPSLPQGCALAR